MTTERDQLRSLVAGFAGDTWSLDTVRASDATATRAAATLQWERLTDELGLCALHVSPDLGGAGLGLADQVVVIEELARVLAPAPLLTAFGMAATIASTGDVVDTETATAVAAGRRRATAVLDLQPRADWDHALTTLPMVLDAADADLVLVPVDDGDVIEVVAVELARAQIELLDTLDPTRTQARVRIVDPPTTVVSRMHHRDWAQAEARIALLVAGELVGIARHALDISVDYARTREQFGRAIGSFQAVKHTLADLHLGVERSAAALRRGLEAAERDDDLVQLAATAKAFASDVAVQATTDAIHVHGGIGFTWEHDLHWYHRRAMSSATLAGSARDHRDRLATALGF